MEKFRVSLLLAILYFSCYGKNNFKIHLCTIQYSWNTYILQVNHSKVPLVHHFTQKLDRFFYTAVLSKLRAGFSDFGCDLVCFASCSQRVSARPSSDCDQLSSPHMPSRAKCKVPDTRFLLDHSQYTKIDVKFGTVM